MPDSADPTAPPLPVRRPPVAIAAVLLFSPDPEALARFYRDQLLLPLRRVHLPPAAPHWACDVRHVYFSIWSVERGAEGSPGLPDAYRPGVAFMVDDVEREFERLVNAGVRVEHPPQHSRLGVIARLRDPEGNRVELYQPAPRG